MRGAGDKKHSSKLNGFNLVFNIFRGKFNFDVQVLDFTQYIKNWVIGSRRYLLKLEDNTIPKAKRIYNFLFWLDSMLKITLYGGLVVVVYRRYFKRISDVPEFIDSFEDVF
jgi:hypothetical protein